LIASPNSVFGWRRPFDYARLPNLGKSSPDRFALGAHGRGQLWGQLTGVATGKTRSFHRLRRLFNCYCATILKGTLRGFLRPPALWLRRAKPAFANAILRSLCDAPAVSRGEVSRPEPASRSRRSRPGRRSRSG
jgi:hypothetical protein